MADVFHPRKRSEVMSRIRSKNTRPEIQVRRLLYAAGFRYRLHVKTLPGRPDVWIPRHRVAVFVNGCFWHQHGCHLFKWPANNEAFWRVKIGRNVDVDRRTIGLLRESGIRVLVVWECALKAKTRLPPGVLAARMSEWIESDAPFAEIGGES